MTLPEKGRLIYVVLRNLLLSGHLLALRQIGHPRRMLYYLNECMFTYLTTFGRRGLPEKTVGEVLPCESVEPIRLGNLRGFTWVFCQSSFASDLMALCLLCRIVKPKTVFEIGTQTGYTAYHWALNSPEHAQVFTLDLPRGAPLAESLKITAADSSERDKTLGVQRMVFHGTPEADRITCLEGDSATFDYAPYHGQVDLFFIDGAHSYAYVKSDTLNALRCCRPGSVIVWHDYGRAGLGGVSRWLEEFARQGHEVYSIPGSSVAFMQVK